MKLTKTIENIGDTLLEMDESTVDWKSDSKVRKSVFSLFTLTLIGLFYVLFSKTLFMNSFMKSESLTALYKLLLITFTTLFIINIFHVSYYFLDSNDRCNF